MSSKKKKGTSRRNVSSVNWVENADGTHSVAMAPKIRSVDSQKKNSWAQIFNPESGQSVPKYTSDENANIVKIKELTLNDAKSVLDDETNSEIQRLIEMTNGKLEMCFLPPYDIPKEIWNAEKYETKLQFDFPVEECRNSADYYVKMYNTLVYFEEAAQTLFVQSFNQDDVDFFYSGNDKIFYFANEKRMAEISAAIDESLLDLFVLKPHKQTDFDDELYRSYEGQIKRKSADKIFVEMSDECFSQFGDVAKNHSFDIKFCLNRLPYQLQHLALDYLNDQHLFDVLINNPKYDETGQSRNEQHEISIDPNSNLNPEQRSAVANIVNATQKTPYVLFGPPGTGKTQTLVATIEQSVRLTDKNCYVTNIFGCHLTRFFSITGTGKTRTLVATIEQIIRTTNQNVLVCAQSNAACDEILERLIPTLSVDEMFRMYATSFDVKKLKSNIKPYSNSIGEKFHYPSLNFLMKYRVLICTLCTAGTLTRSGIPSNHFSYVIIDECASAHETMTLIPIAGLCTRSRKILANIVVAGDPKQLDAVTKSEHANKLGFRTSFMEHLCERQLYKCDPETKKFCKKYITQLIRNYRSHESILKIPNELFYNGTLLAKASDDTTNWFINHSLLPSKKFPIIFQSVQGHFERSDANKSLFNMDEVTMVMYYIEKLLRTKLKNGRIISQEDIGVVTPYKMQRRFIAQACHRQNLEDITIGTAEVFQGQEKPVMILSTVRSGGNKLGFVNNPRRFNVMITRAKCLLIIVGDPHLLRYDANWRKLITFCFENNALIQSKYRYPQ